MGDKVPLSWIEYAEAKEVLSAALFEQAPAPSWCRTGREAIAQWLPKIGAWLAPAPVLQMQPAMIRHLPCRHARRQANDSSYTCEW